eukprot:TRINITY_DN454_c0_g1_i1.p1 TRINITY_DN454_c0_g1~~TRINITY_DN454_c0_g1_i1.p1  ORF type:complete len:241 (-),score=41.59 TRINITY_DN454_c0_g1_i1:893-1615(-)
MRGQTWTTQSKMSSSGHRNCFQVVEPNLYGIGTVPKFGIGQRALLVKTPEGNLLWDCITLLDQATEDIVRALGGLRAIAISHPHYYAASTEWSRVFKCPIHVHAWDEAWVTWPHVDLQLWEGDQKALWGGLSLVHVGGHFAGAQILHWKEGAAGEGAVLTGDILQVCPDLKSVSVMRSFPNFVPVSAPQIRRIQQKLESWQFGRVHGAFWDLVIATEGKDKVKRSLERYLTWLEVDDIRA